MPLGQSEDGTHLVAGTRSPLDADQNPFVSDMPDMRVRLDVAG
jgi:hypothetical protein